MRAGRASHRTVDGHTRYPPWQITLELVEGCPLRCHSCGVRGIRRDEDKSLRLMRPHIWNAVARGITDCKWLTKVVFSGRGEPAVHPYLLDACEQVRHWSRDTPIWMETSGLGLMGEHLVDPDLQFISVVNRLAILKESGLNQLVVARRNGSQHIWDMLERRREEFEAHLEVRIMKGEPTYNWEGLIIWLVPDVTTPVVSKSPWVMPHTPAWSHCGAGAAMTRYRHGRKCLQPTVDMVVRYDGKVAICAEDYRGEVILGDVTMESLADIWFGDLALAVRDRARHGERDLRPCRACDRIETSGSTAAWGRELQLPTPEQRSLVEAALRRGAATKPVLRPWERATPPPGPRV